MADDNRWYTAPSDYQWSDSSFSMVEKSGWPMPPDLEEFGGDFNFEIGEILMRNEYSLSRDIKQI